MEGAAYLALSGALVVDSHLYEIAGGSGKQYQHAIRARLVFIA